MEGRPLEQRGDADRFAEVGGCVVGLLAGHPGGCKLQVQQLEEYRKEGSEGWLEDITGRESGMAGGDD